MKTDLLQRNLLGTRNSLPLKIKKRKNLNTFKGPVAPNLRRGEIFEKKRCFQKKKSQKYKKSMKKKRSKLV
jgi:hypothetical protein